MPSPALRTGAAVGALLVGGLAGSPVMAVEPDVALSPPPRTVAYAVAPDRAVLAVDSGGRGELTTAVARDSAGRLVGRSVLTAAGQGLIPLTLRPGSTQIVQVTYTNATAVRVRQVAQSVTLRTDAGALRTSPWRVVNKQTPLAAADAPSRTVRVEGVPVEPQTGAAMQTLLRKARAAGLDVYPANGFRSYNWQKSLYAHYVRGHGTTGADTFSARPGYSEHQTGLAFDAKSRREGCDLEACFGGTRAGRYLAQHAAATGFVVRYTAGAQPVTGYQPEPWHLRYVGTWLTRYLRDAGKASLEDAFAMPPAPTYQSR